MAVTKTHPIKSTLKAAIDYICNPDKTDGKLLVSSFGCAAETADAKLYKGRNQTVKRAADNKRRYAPEEGSIPPVLLSGVSKGVPPLAHDFAKQSVVCYTCWRG